MAIEKNNFKGSLRFDSEFSVGSRSKESMSSDDNEHRKRGGRDSDDDDEFDDADSGAGSDDFDLLELGESGSEFCQVGDQTCCIPFELYDLPDLREIFSLDVWNECLTEDEQFSLTKYLPDMDQEIFMLTLKELFDGGNFHFGSPVAKLFEMLKGGLCEPRVALYRQGLNFFQRKKHYHFLRMYQDSMVSSLLQTRETWQHCMGYSIEEKLRVLNVMRSRKSLMGEKMENVETGSSEREEHLDEFWNKKVKRRNDEQKSGHESVYCLSPPLDTFRQGNAAGLEKGKYGKQNPKGVLKLHGAKKSAQKSVAARAHDRGNKISNFGLHGSDIIPSHKKITAFDSRGPPLLFRDQREGEYDAEGTMHDMAIHRDQYLSYGGVMDRVGSGCAGKRRVNDGYMHQPLYSNDDIPSYSGNMNVNQLSDITILTAKPSNMRPTYDLGKSAKYRPPAYEDQMRSVAAQASNPLVRRSRAEFFDGVEQYRGKNASGEAHFTNRSSKFGQWEVRSSKFMGRQLPEDCVLNSDKRAKLSQEKSRGASLQNGGALLKSGRIFSRDEETDSDSLDQFDEEEDSNPLMMSKVAFPTGLLESSHSSALKSVKRNKIAKKGRKPTAQTVDVMEDFAGQQQQLLDMNSIPAKGGHKAKMQCLDHLPSSTSGRLEDSYIAGLSKSTFESDRKSTRRLGKNRQVPEELAGGFPLSLPNASPAERRQKGTSNYLQDSFIEEYGSPFDIGHVGTSGQNAEAEMGHHERSNTTLLGCNSTGRKRKGKDGSTSMDRKEDSDYLQSASLQQQDDSISLRKRTKKKSEMDNSFPDLEASEPSIPEPVVTEVEQEITPQKKQYILITPTIHTGFKFSIVHLLSAVRMAMIMSNEEGIAEVEKQHRNADETQKPEVNQLSTNSGMNGACQNMDTNNPEHTADINVPSLTIQAIVDRVRASPGDACILETQEPLQDLVRGVLKIFSSRTAPLGAKGWKPLVSYEKSTKGWSWIGPLSQNSSDSFTPEEITSPDGWGVPHKMLVKLVDSFANWLKSGQETLQQIGSLPAPPVELMQANLDEKERFKDLRAQKSLTTINSSSEEVRAYFRREEELRYTVPDRAFSYTAADGKKSIVAPLRRCGGKPTAKARDHFMLKRDRPPHVTILCLVRDAAARLPGSIGTRADVCTLIRDSQYIVDDVSDAQVNQVVSGALDRLHYERDPCVQFDGERKLWVYLHRDREEEDFEDDGTSSTKKWKRPKKDAPEQGDQGAVTVACHGSTEQSGFDLGSDLNVEPTCADNDKMDMTYDDTRQNIEDPVGSSQVPEQGTIQQAPPMVWETLGLDPMQEHELQCQKSSTHEDFGDEAFGRERQVGLLGANL